MLVPLDLDVQAALADEPGYALSGVRRATYTRLKEIYAEYYPIDRHLVVDLTDLIDQLLKLPEYVNDQPDSHYVAPLMSYLIQEVGVYMSRFISLFGIIRIDSRDSDLLRRFRVVCSVSRSIRAIPDDVDIESFANGEQGGNEYGYSFKKTRGN